MRTRLFIAVEKKTGVISYSHGLGYGIELFYPSKFQKLRCINQHAIDKLEYHRNYSAKLRYLKPKKIKKYSNKFIFCERVNDGWYNYEVIRYNEKSGTIHYYNLFTHI